MSLATQPVHVPSSLFTIVLVHTWPSMVYVAAGLDEQGVAGGAQVAGHGGAHDAEADETEVERGGGHGVVLRV